MTLDEKITFAIEKAIKEADSIWEKVGDQFLNESKRAMFTNQLLKAQTISHLPELPFLENGKPIVANYIALVLDIRGSTDHLITAIQSKASQLRRVVTETFVINAMGAIIIQHYEGAITEYLGDGFLAFFKVEDEQNIEKRDADVTRAYRCAIKCLDKLDEILNPLLKKHYNLPPLKIGIGMAYSKAIVTVVGSEPNFQVKAIGQCVFRAAKMSGEINQIATDDVLERIWPKAVKGKKGAVKFNKKTIDPRFPSFIIERQ